MLPRAYLHFQRDGARVTPSWLLPEHDAWLDTMIDALAACEGVSSAEADARVEGLESSARKLGIAASAAAGVWHVLRGFARTEVDSRVDPKDLRTELFELAASTSIDAAIAQACSIHGVDAACLRSWLYADVPAARVVRMETLPTAPQLRDAYNVALAQGLLARCVRVTVSADELRPVVRAAKLQGLLVSIDADGPTVRASGPLALFRQTRKYAHALASFLPALVTHERWSLEGELGDGDEGILCLDDSAPFPDTWPVPAYADSALERTLIRTLARTETGWTIRREPLVLRADGELFFPDFVLERAADRVLVEVVGFWTPDYLERKVAQLATIADAPLVVCVDETLACDPSSIANADVLRFRRRLDPNELLAAAERATQDKLRRCTRERS